MPVHQTREACEVRNVSTATGVSPPSKDEEAQDGTCRRSHRLEALKAVEEKKIEINGRGWPWKSLPRREETVPGHYSLDAP